MSLFNTLAALAEAGKPVRVGMTGAGKFGSMLLSQAPRTPGLHVAAGHPVPAGDGACLQRGGQQALAPGGMRS